MTKTEAALESGVNQHCGYVAFLDVLGFRAIVGSQNSEEKLANYTDTVDNAIQLAGPCVLQYVIFSDSVVVNSNRDDDESFESILAACATLFAKFLQSGIAMRGAIAHGQFLRSSKPNGAFVAGRPIVEAYDYENRQNWVGIMLSPSTIARQPDLEQKCKLPDGQEIKLGFDLKRLRLPSLIWRNRGIPFHKDDESSLAEPDSFDGYALLPTGNGVTHANIIQKLDDAIRSLERLKMVAPDPKAQQKYRSAIEWLRSNVRECWAPTVLYATERV